MMDGEIKRYVSIMSVKACAARLFLFFYLFICVVTRKIMPWQHYRCMCACVYYVFMEMCVCVDAVT